MKRLILILAVLALVAAACSSGGDVLEVGVPTGESPAEDGPEGEESPDPDETDQPEDGATQEDDGATQEDAPVVSTGGGGDFCALALELDSGPSALDPAFFDEMDDVWDAIGASIPAELQGDLASVKDGLDELRALLEQYDYDFLNEELAAAMAALDTTAIDAAGQSIETYISDVCGIDPDPGSGGSSAAPGIDPGAAEDLLENLEGIDPGDEAAVFMEIFGIDEELAQCLLGEFEDIDPNNIDASMLTQEVCGTTLLEVVSGLGG